MENDDYELTYSPLGQTVTRDGVSLEVRIYRGPDDSGWILQVEDKDGGSTIWEDQFPTDQEALDEAVSAIDTEGIESFVAPSGSPVDE